MSLRIVVCAAAAAAVLLAGNNADGEAGQPDQPDGPDIVYVDDQTGPGYPVRQAAAVWDKGLRNVVIRYGTCKNDGTCITVVERDAGATDWVGETRTPSFGDGVTVTFNTTYGGTAHGRAQVACHELGHALGADHRGQLTSCMWAQEDENASTRPDARDLAAVDAKHRPGR